MAFLRCDKDHSKRFLFNGAHFLIGITAFLLASKVSVFCHKNFISSINLVSAMYLATFLQASSSNLTIRYILFGWCGWLIIEIIVLEILKCRKLESMSRLCVKSNIQYFLI